MVTGFRGRGKTTFSLGADRGENICMLDFESKGEALASQIKVGGYFPILDICADTHGFNFRPIQIFNATRTILEAMPSNRFTTLILDNAGWLQEGCLAEVKRSPVTYGIDPERALKGNYGGAWPGVNYILKSLFSIFEHVTMSFVPGRNFDPGRPARAGPGGFASPVPPTQWPRPRPARTPVRRRSVRECRRRMHRFS